MARGVKNIKPEKPAAAIEMVKLANYQPTIAVEIETPQGYVKNGVDNLFPQYIINLYQSTPDHGALVTGISFMVAGKGFTVKSPLIPDRILPPTAMDLKLQGGFFWEVIYSNDGQSVVEVNHLPFETIRLDKEKYDEEQDEVIIAGAWYSRDWADTNKKLNRPQFIPRYNPTAVDENRRQIFWAFLPQPGDKYYPLPDYYTLN
jgi:hypothetical protein